jgi:hypothetical protein
MTYKLLVCLPIFFLSEVWGANNPTSVGLYTSPVYPDSILVLVTSVSDDANESAQILAIQGCLLPQTTFDDLQERGIFVLKTGSGQFHFDPFVDSSDASPAAPQP